jgi:hypothetical protein
MPPTLRASPDLRMMPVTLAAARGRRSGWSLPVSLAAHTALLLVLALWAVARPLQTQPPVSIDVEIIRGPPSPAPQTPRSPTVLQASTPSSTTASPPVIPPRVKPISPPAPSPSAGMAHPTHLLAQAYIREPASLEIRQNLPKLAPSERVTQICNIEAGQQIEAAATAKILVDTVHAFGLGDATVEGLTITAPEAAYRSHRKWYAVSFICTVAADFSRVTDFKFKVRAAIPRDQWDAHALNTADENE